MQKNTVYTCITHCMYNANLFNLFFAKKPSCLHINTIVCNFLYFYLISYLLHSPGSIDFCLSWKFNGPKSRICIISLAMWNHKYIYNCTVFYCSYIYTWLFMAGKLEKMKSKFKLCKCKKPLDWIKIWIYMYLLKNHMFIKIYRQCTSKV